VAQSLRSLEGDHNDRVHVGGRYAFGRLSGCGEHRSERRIRAARV